MRRLLLAATLLAPAPALADLAPGTAAPTFTAPAAKGGQVSTFSLAEALKSGPVVLYFYPAAFTPGCTQEAHEFADAVEKFHALGATVIGVSQDPIGKLQRFSVSECRSKFPVASDADGAISRSYEATMAMLPYSSRTSYVIAPDDRVLYAYSAMSPENHVANTLAAVQRWHDQHAAK
jgi:thioredoxin-dependent peroxiredoxin